MYRLLTRDHGRADHQRHPPERPKPRLSARPWGPLLLIATTLSGCALNEDQKRSETDQLSAQASTQIELETRRDEVIYGEDTRLDVYELNDPELEQRARRSIMAMFASNNIQEDPNGGVLIRGETLGQRYNLCDDQRFRDQPAASSCSATLIDDDVIVTAGHCVESQAECEDKRFVLGYLMETPDALAPVRAEDVFSCEQLIVSVNTNALDYAFIKLDRPVNPMLAEPARVIQTPEPVTLNEPLVMMGFPSGLPLKVDSGGFVSDPRDSGGRLNYFRATVDAFGGNSGSGVFNAEGEQVGILVRGETDYIPSADRCTVVNELNLDRGPGEDAEELTYLSRALQALCDSGYPSERLCGQSLRGLCFDCAQDTDCIEGYRCGRFELYPEAPTFCAPTCEMDEESCPEGHTCVGGQCTPNETRSCDGDQVVAVDSCGRQLGLVESCAETQYCRRGACLEAAVGNTCEDSIELEVIDQLIRGTLQEGVTSTTTGSCGGEGPELFYRFELAQPNRLIATSTGLDTVLHLRAGCDADSELTCVDDSRPPGRYGSRIETLLDPGVYHLALDSFNPNERGNFNLEIDFCEAVCELGAFRCPREGEIGLDECRVGADGCVGWVPVEPCGGGAVCREGSCAEPAFADTCDSAVSVAQRDVQEQWAWGESWTPDHTLSAGSTCAPFAFADAFYQLEVTTESRVSAALISESGLALALYEGCPRDLSMRGELTCSLRSLEEPVSLLDTVVSPGEYTLVAVSEGVGEYEVVIELEPTCVNECDPAQFEPYCVGVEGEDGEPVDGVSGCVLQENGCAQLEVIDLCLDTVCAGGACQDECFAVCEEGEGYCVTQSLRGYCSIDEQGCGGWVEELCGADEVCAGEGVCVPEESDWGALPDLSMEEIDAGVDAGEVVVGGAPPPPPPSDWVGYQGPREVELGERVRGGCQASSYHRPFDSLMGLIMLGGIIGLIGVWRRRAQRRDLSLGDR